METNIDEIKIKELKEQNKKFAVFAFDKECGACNEFIPKAVEELEKYTDVYYIEINDMVLPAQTMPCLYMFKNNEKATLRVGNAPIDIVRKDFERFFK